MTVCLSMVSTSFLPCDKSQSSLAVEMPRGVLMAIGFLLEDPSAGRDGSPEKAPRCMCCFSSACSSKSSVC